MFMLPRMLEAEVMDSPAEARDYDAMDHAEVNRLFVADFLAFKPDPGRVLDVGTGTAQIPIELCRRHEQASVVAIDLAEHMLTLGRQNVSRAGLDKRIELRRVDAKGLPFADASFTSVLSNSIVHHIPQPRHVLGEMVRVLAPDGAVFVRDLLRPESDAEVVRLVELYAGAADAHQRQMFDDSLRAALTLAEIQELLGQLGLDPAGVRQTSDRHWTWTAEKS
jgi:ubiquinone/menaquinone biosynthesis C-methylase UbiE